MSWQQRWLDRFYDRTKGWLSGTERFHEMIAERVPRGGKILEIGAGPSNETSRFLATLGEVHGLDPDPSVADNDALAGWTVLENDRFPFAEATFETCVSNYVLEHIERAQDHLREISSILAPGGAYLFRTPNLHHYVSIVSRLTPHRFHLMVANRMRDMPEGSHDPYPTVYRLNTRRSIRRAARNAGLVVERLSMIESEPMYGLSSRALFITFMTYERIVNSSEIFAGLRVNIIGSLAKNGPVRTV